MKPKIDKFNDYIAQIVVAVTGNMFFFWFSFTFILTLRLIKPPSLSELLLDIENDLQLLLLAASAVVGAKQTTLLIKVLQGIKQEEDKIEDQILTIEQNKK